MTELLQQVIAQIEKLPLDRQDAIAARFLAELQDEQNVTINDRNFDSSLLRFRLATRGSAIAKARSYSASVVITSGTKYSNKFMY
jgi:hypothetical protein